MLYPICKKPPWWRGPRAHSVLDKTSLVFIPDSGPFAVNLSPGHQDPLSSNNITFKWTKISHRFLNRNDSLEEERLQMSPHWCLFSFFFLSVRARSPLAGSITNPSKSYVSLRHANRHAELILGGYKGHEAPREWKAGVKCTLNY